MRALARGKCEIVLEKGSNRATGSGMVSK
jgi:hypothetical protein